MPANANNIANAQCEQTLNAWTNDFLEGFKFEKKRLCFGDYIS